MQWSTVVNNSLNKLNAKDCSSGTVNQSSSVAWSIYTCNITVIWCFVLLIIEYTNCIWEESPDEYTENDSESNNHPDGYVQQTRLVVYNREE